MTLILLSPSEIRCLKEIYIISIEKNEKVSSVKLARNMKIKPSSVIDTLNKLVAKGLVIRKPWSYIKLTQKGITLARELIHHHRVLEMFYIENFGLNSEEACAEASKIDYLINCRIISSIYDKLKSRNTCIHGNPLYPESCR